jgi:hypothetical protein
MEYGSFESLGAMADGNQAVILREGSRSGKESLDRDRKKFFNFPNRLDSP